MKKKVRLLLFEEWRNNAQDFEDTSLQLDSVYSIISPFSTDIERFIPGDKIKIISINKETYTIKMVDAGDNRNLKLDTFEIPRQDLEIYVKMEVSGDSNLPNFNPNMMQNKNLPTFENKNDKSIWEKYNNNLPSIFKRTIYRLPTNEELKEFEDYQLTADDVIKGFGYTIIGRGIKSKDNIEMIFRCIEMLSLKYPNNDNYKMALKNYKTKNNIQK